MSAKIEEGPPKICSSIKATGTNYKIKATGRIIRIFSESWKLTKSLQPPKECYVRKMVESQEQ